MSVSSVPGLGNLLLRLWRHLSRHRRRQFALLMVLMLVSAAAEVVSLGAVLPFIGVLTAPARVYNQPLVHRLASMLGVTGADQLTFPLTVLFAAAALGAAGIRMVLLWADTQFVVASTGELSVEVYRRTLYQPYSVHVGRNSAGVISSISKVSTTVSVLSQLLALISSAILLVIVAAALFAFNPRLATYIVGGFGASYGLISWLTRRRLRKNSARISHEYTQVVKALQEGLGGIRDVLLDGAQPVYCDVFRRADAPLRRAYGNNSFISQSPRFGMEAIGMIVIAGLAYGLSRQPDGITAALPILGALGLGAQRLLPALQLSYNSWAGIAGAHASLADTVEMLDQPVSSELLAPPPPALAFRHAVSFDSVRFRYGADGPWVLKGLDLAIPKGARIGLVGSTGSGKTTALDILMGLLPPTEGRLLVDGEAVSGLRLRAWQQAIAHVPQNIFLADLTLAENIALGVPRDTIDMDRVRRAARQAQIATFIEGRPEAYDAHVGERGVRLSGGQRQRIGIARALYKQASVLVFDEATSALDNATEQSVIEAIEGLDRDLTILFVAHRLTTVRHCDAIVELEQGRVVAQGTYEQLLESSPSFRQMVHAGV